MLWHLLNYKEPFNPEVFAKEEAKMKRQEAGPLASPGHRPELPTHSTAVIYTPSFSGGRLSDQTSQHINACMILPSSILWMSLK
jgi:hypothetical protein